MTTLEEKTYGDIFASTRHPRQVDDITIKTGQGVCARGTLLNKEIVESAWTGKYVKWDGTSTLEGVLLEEVDATSEDVTTYMVFDVDLVKSKLTAASGVTIAKGYHHESGINIKEEV